MEMAKPLDACDGITTTISQKTKIQLREILIKPASHNMSGAKYFWGDDFFPVHLYIPLICFVTTLIPIYLELVVTPTAPGLEIGMDLVNTKFTVLATLLWISVLFNGYGHQVILKFAVKDGIEIGEGAFNVAELTVMNQIEQGLVFLPLLWMHCAHVDAGEAGDLGLLYVFFRALYQICFACKRAVASRYHQIYDELQMVPITRIF